MIPYGRKVKAYRPYRGPKMGSRGEKYSTTIKFFGGFVGVAWRICWVFIVLLWVQNCELRLEDGFQYVFFDIFGTFQMLTKC